MLTRLRSKFYEEFLWLGNQLFRSHAIVRHIPRWANENPPEPQLLGQGQEEEKVSGVGNGSPAATP